MIEKRLNLLHLKAGQKSRVLEIAGGSSLKHRMLSMGIYPGREIAKLSHIALKGPITIKVGRAHIALGHSIASKIILSSE
jgi:Fe2+ transport system protein FeoA